MPKSKRNKQVELSKTKKRGLEWKKKLFEEVRKCVDTYANVFVFSVNDMRNSKMKNVREQWKHSRFFIGKNKIMAMALGRSAEEEYKPNLHKLGQQIKGQRGLLFSNKPTEEVLSWFRSYSEGDYARSGNTATETVNLTAGPLAMFPHSLEPYLRQLGLPTSLVKGVIHLVKDHEVCKAGDTLSPETAKIMKLLGYEMAEFHITIDCVWAQDGTFLQLTESIETDTKVGKKKAKKSSLGKISAETVTTPDVEEMEVEQDENQESNADADEEEDSEAEDEELDDGFVMSDPTSTPKALDTCLKDQDENQESDADEEDDSEAGDEDEELGDGLVMSNPTSTPKALDTCLKENVEPESQDKTDNIVAEFEIDETLGVIDTKPSDVNEDPKPKGNKGRPSTAKTPKARKQSLPKTPEADKSQDSPVFRQLRNRSVKMSTKKKMK